MNSHISPAYLSTTEQLADFLSAVDRPGILAVDTEFHSEKTYYARLCLIQLSTEEAAALVDPLTIDDLTPLARVFDDERVVKIFHAGNQDIDILNRACGSVPHPVFDTQVAAGLLGHPQQIGYGALVKAFCGVQLPKADSFTDWTRRPLSDTQRAYAIDDVLYLPGIYHHMRARLEKAGRLEWLTDDFERLADPESYRNHVEDAWRKVKRVSSLTRRQLAVAQAVAAWRERTAQAKNLPRKWVLADELVVEIARRAPQSREELLEVRGVDEHMGRKVQDRLVADIRDALARDPQTWPHVARRPHVRRDAAGVVDLMQALLHLRAQENGVASQIIATKDDLVHLLHGEVDDLPLMTGWRRRIVGDELCRLLEGGVDLRVEQGVLKVTTRPVEADAREGAVPSDGQAQTDAGAAGVQVVRLDVDGGDGANRDGRRRMVVSRHD